MRRRKADKRNERIKRKRLNPDPPAGCISLQQRARKGSRTDANPFSLEANCATHRTYRQERKEQLDISIGVWVLNKTYTCAVDIEM